MAVCGQTRWNLRNPLSNKIARLTETSHWWTQGGIWQPHIRIFSYIHVSHARPFLCRVAGSTSTSAACHPTWRQAAPVFCLRCLAVHIPKMCASLEIMFPFRNGWATYLFEPFWSILKLPSCIGKKSMYVALSRAQDTVQHVWSRRWLSSFVPSRGITHMPSGYLSFSSGNSRGFPRGGANSHWWNPKI
jgi:hypothetical protein